MQRMAHALDMFGSEEFMLLSALHEGLDEALCLTSVRQDRPDAEIIYVNHAFTRLTGYTSSELIGRSPRVLDGSATDRVVLRRLRKRLRSGERFDGELVQYRKDGSPVRVAGYVVPIRREHTVQGFLAVFRAVPEPRPAADEAMTKLVAGVRHELANPINALKTALSVLDAGLDLFPREKQHAYVGQLLHEVQHMEHVLRTMGGFGAAVAPELSPVAVEPFVTGLIASGALARLEIEAIAPGLTVLADPNALRQVLVNVVDNAWAAVEGRSSPEVKLEAVPTRAGVELRIHDNGVGFTEEGRERGLEPFWTTKPSGTGMGLAICDQLMRRMRGAIRIDSVPGQGCTVTLRLERA